MGNCAAKKKGKPIDPASKENRNPEALSPEKVESFLDKKLTLEEYFHI